MTSTPKTFLAPFTPITLEGEAVRLEPLAASHAPELRALARDEQLWQWVPTSLATDARFDEWLPSSLGEVARGAAIVFAIIDRATSRAVGSTRYFDVHPAYRNLEIGWTWLARSAWRTPINTEAKYLLLTHAFEALGCIRVQLKTNAKNARSRAAIERIGAKFEGVLRNHVINDDGSLRDTAMYSIIDTEWPEAKAALEAKMKRR